MKVNREGKIHLRQGHPCWDSIPCAALSGSRPSARWMMLGRFGGGLGVEHMPPWQRALEMLSFLDTQTLSPSLFF